MAILEGRRLVVVGPRKLEIQDHTIDTDSLRPGEIAVRNRWSLISPGTEGAIFTGENPRVYEAGSWCCYPFNLGYTSLGQVVACGPETPGFTPGDFVLAQGPHAEYFVLDSRSRLCIALSPEQARRETLLARLAAIALTAPLMNGRTLLKRVVVAGLGLVGNLAAQLYRLGGAEVIGVDPLPGRRRIAEACGLLTASDLDGAAGGIDIFVDAVGSPAIVSAAPELMRAHGSIVLLGSPKRMDEKLESLGFFTEVHRRALSVIGALESAIPFQSDPGKESRTRSLADAVRLIHTQRLTVAPLITHRFRYTDAVEAFTAVVDEKESHLGVVFDWPASE